MSCQLQKIPGGANKSKNPEALPAEVHPRYLTRCQKKKTAISFQTVAEEWSDSEGGASTKDGHKARIKTTESPDGKGEKDWKKSVSH